MKITKSLLGIFFLHCIQLSTSQLFEYDCVDVPFASGTTFNVDEQTPFGVVFSPSIDGKFNRMSLLKASSDLNGTAYLYEGVVVTPGLQDPISSLEFYNTYDTNLLSIYFDSVDISAGTTYTVFITLGNTSFAIFYEGIASNVSGSIVYMGTALSYAVAHETCIRYNVAIEQEYSTEDGLTTDEITTIVAAVGVPLVSLFCACFGVLLRHGLTAPEDNIEEAKRSGPVIETKEKEEKNFWPKFPKTPKSEIKKMKRESEAPSSNEASEDEDDQKRLREEDAETSDEE